MTSNDSGLNRKYSICKADGTPVDDNAEYFVLRLDKGCKDEIHLNACISAVMLYAEEIKHHLPDLHRDIVCKYGSKETELYFDNALERQRKFLKMSLSQAAKKIGCSKPHLWEIEKGKILNPSASIVLGMSRVYGLEAGFILENLEQNRLSMAADKD